MSGRRTFVAGEILTASNINSFLMNQVVAVFDDEADRDNAIPSPVEGQFVYMKDPGDVDGVLFYDGSDWKRALLNGETTGSAVVGRNTALGVNAHVNNVTGFRNTAIGNEALRENTDGNRNTAVGVLVLGENLTGANNTGVGTSALFFNTSGGQNTAVGNLSLTDNTTASNNTAVGDNALRRVTTGSFNTAVGTSALANIVTASEDNTAIGVGAGEALTSGSNNLFLGFAATPSTSSRSNQITLGNSAINSLRCNVTSISSLSDVRDKTDIEDLPLGLEFVNQLRPVSFTWARRDGSMGSKPDIGFIAQELAEAEDAVGEAERLELTLRDDPEKLEASPGRLIPILVKAIQDLSARIDELESS